MLCHIVEVHSDGRLVEKLNAFHSNLDVLLDFIVTFDFIELVDAVFLLDFVALCEDNLLEAFRSL